VATLLAVEGITLRFGGIVALDGVSFDVEGGHISGLIGPNGAGKTTAFNVITRLYTPDDGRLVLDGRSLLDTPPHRVVENGIARTFQNINMFSSMSVLENVLVGAHSQGRQAGERRRAQRSTTSASAAGPMTSRLRCPTASRSASRSRGRLPQSLVCSCSMSRRVGSTTRRWRSSVTSSCGYGPTTS